MNYLKNLNYPNYLKSTAYILAVLLSTFSVIYFVYAANTTIGSNITTTGTLTVGGVTALSSTLTVSGASSSIATALGIASTSPWGSLSVEMSINNPSFVVSNNGSSTPSFWVGGVNQNGRIGIGTSTPPNNFMVQGNADDATTSIEIYTPVTGDSPRRAIFGTFGSGNPIRIGTQFSDSFGIITNDIERLSVKSDGLIGIASTSPWGLLSVEMDTTNPSFVVSNNGSSTPSLYIGGVNQNGYVGIGTSTPDQALTVVGNIGNLAASSSLRLTGSSADASPSGSAFVSGRYAYVTNENDNTLLIFDLSTSSPAQVGQVTTGSTPQPVYVSGRYAYVGSDKSGGQALEIFDVSSPSSPYLISSSDFNLGSSPLGLAVSGRYAYVTSGVGPFRIYDVSDPKNPKITGMAALSGGDQDIGAISISGNFAYLLVGTTIQKFDVSNPALPVLTGSANTGSSPSGLYVSGRYAYLGSISPGMIKIFDISTSSPSLIGSLTLPNGAGAGAVGVVVSGRYAYAINTDQATNNFIDIVDVSNPISPVLVSHNATDVSASVVVNISGRNLYFLSDSPAALQVYDIGGLETTSAIIHSLEAGNLQVRNDIFAQGQLQITGGGSFGSGGILSTGPLGVSATTSKSTFLGGLVIGTSTPATTSPNYPSFGQSMVVIEGTSTRSVPLTLRGVGTQIGNYFQIQDSTNVNQLIVTSGGKLGLGTTSPSQLLSVHGNAFFSGNLAVAMITATGSIGAGTSSPAAELSASSTPGSRSATTTVYLETPANVGGCIQLKSASGTVYRLYIGASDTATTSDTGRQSGIPVIWEIGSCK